jgi:hypothetical protein
MELTEGSETSANHNLTPGKYPKEQIQLTEYLKLIKSPLHNEVHAARTHETETISISERTTPKNKFNKIGHRHLQYVMLLVTSWWIYTELTSKLGSLMTCFVVLMNVNFSAAS